jgi:ligand-binding sensor domain-containing protein/two-component sensor histidine kinase
MRKPIVLVLLCLLSAALAFSAVDTGPSAPGNPSEPGASGAHSFNLADRGRPTFRIFTDSDGLPLNAIMTLAVDQKKYLWAGTQDGAAYYNGRRWTSLRMPKQAGTNFIHDILAARDGGVWFATDGDGVFRWKDGEWLEKYDMSSGLPTNATRALLETMTPAGAPVLWVGTREGLARLENGKWEVFKKASGLPDDRVRCLLETVSENNERVLWVGTYGGLARFEKGQWTSIDAKSGLPGNVVFCLLETLTPAGERVLWAGTDAGLARLENGHWTTFDQSSGLPVNGVRSLRETISPDGTRSLWVGTDGGGLARLEKGQWSVFDTKTWLTSNLVWDLLETGERDGALWIATLGGGLVRLERSNWVTFNTQTGLPNNLIYSFLETVTGDNQRALWIGTYGGGLARLENGKQTIFDKKSGLPDDHVQALLETQSATGERVVWAGTEGGLARFERSAWTVFGKKDGLPADDVWDLLETISDENVRTLWVATSGGLARLENGAWTTYDDKSGLPDARLRSLLETKASDGKRTLWVGTYNRGLAKFEDGKWTTLNTSSGLPNNRILDIAEIRDESGRRFLWLGTGGGGAARLDLDTQGAKWETISSAVYPAMLNDYVYQVRQDAGKRIYLTTNKGVVRLTHVQPTPDNDSRYLIYTFTTADGLPSNECNAGASLVDSQGRVWAGTINGAAMFDPSKELEDRAPKPLYIERTHVADKLSELTHGTSLAYDQNNLKFEFALLSHFRESATRYRTQMVGLEEKPTDWDASPNREFNYLPDGDYVFKVWGMDYAGNISGPLEMPFSVRPAPWKTWWAYLLYALLIAALGAFVAYMVHRYRLKRLLEVERVRTRIATDLHDDIGASLSQIAVLSEVVTQRMGNGGSQEAARPLARIADTSRELVLSMSDVVWSINPKRDHLRDLVQRMRRFASEVFTARNIDFDFRAPEADKDFKLDVDVRRQIFLIFKESVNNIVRHSGCAKAEIDFEKRDGWLVLRLSDDGRGFDASGQTEGNGLSNMRSRAQSVQGVLEVTSENGKGTTVSLKVPASQHSLFGRTKFPPA